MRSLAQIKQEIIDDILELRSDVRIVAGDPQHDVVVAAPAQQFYRYEVLLEFEDRTRNLDEFKSIIADDEFKTTLADVLGYKQDGAAYTTDDIDDWISERLDAYVKDFNVTRDSGTKATGIARVYLTSASAVSWDNSTTFTSKAGIEYTATSSVSAITPNYDSSVGLYYVDITIEASAAGSAGNASANSLTAMDPQPSNYSYSSNTAAISGGTDEELDLDLIERAEEVWARRSEGTKGASERLAEEESYVSDVVAIDRDDEDNKIYIGSPCDIVTQFGSTDYNLVEETFYWPGEDSNNSHELFYFTPANQPLISSVDPVVFVYTTPGDVEEQVVPTVVVDGMDTIVEIVKDTGTYADSTKAVDKIKIQMVLNTDSYQRKLKILYTYDKSPYKLQAVFNDSENRLIGPNVLVKKAIQVPLRVIVEPVYTFGSVEETVQANILSNIQAFFNGGTTTYGKQFAKKTIGEDVAHSDIGNIIFRTDGVASYDTDTFFVINILTGDLTDPTVILANEYASLHDVVFVYSAYNLSNFSGSSS